MPSRKMKCSICKGKLDVKLDGNGQVYWDKGNNAEPVNNGRCCDKCNFEVVIPARMNEVQK